MTPSEPSGASEPRVRLPSPPEAPDLPEPPAAGELEADARVTREPPATLVTRLDQD